MDIKVIGGEIKDNRMLLLCELAQGEHPFDYKNEYARAQHIMTQQASATFSGKIGDDSETSEVIGKVKKLITKNDPVSHETIVGVYIEVDMYVRGV